MPQFKEQCYSDYTVIQLAQLILDIEKYPEFLPWCSDARIAEYKGNELIADLTITYKGYRESYRSLVKFYIEPHQAGIEATMLEGSFKYLRNTWTIEAEKNGNTKLEFFVDFELRSTLLGKVLNLFFFSACKKMVAAFEQRANKLFREE
jgi:coenzyme Q-binding protein COQ10